MGLPIHLSEAFEENACCGTIAILRTVGVASLYHTSRCGIGIPEVEVPYIARCGGVINSWVGGEAIYSERNGAVYSNNQNQQVTIPQCSVIHHFNSFPDSLSESLESCIESQLV